jgi:hypothetical protein
MRRPVEFLILSALLWVSAFSEALEVKSAFQQLVKPFYSFVCLSSVQHGAHSLSVETDPVGFYLAATSQPAGQLDISRFVEFDNARLQLISFAKQKLRVVTSGPHKDVIATHLALLENGGTKGYVSLWQLLGSATEISFHATDEEVSWAGRESVLGSFSEILNAGAVPLLAVQDDLLTRHEMMDTRGIFTYRNQLTFTRQFLDGEWMDPWRVLHHDTRHTVRKLYADLGSHFVRDALGKYRAPLTFVRRNRRALEKSNDSMRNFLTRIKAIPDATFRERVDSVAYLLFHDGINVPDYVTMPWQPPFVSQVLAGRESRAYVMNNLAPRLEWGQDATSLSAALDWIQINIE